MASLLAQNTFYLTIASVGQKLIAFVYFLFVARVLQPERTGQYFLALSIGLIFSVVADFGITPVVVRETAKNPEKTEDLFRRALCLKIPLLIFGYAFTVSASFFLGYDPEIIFFTALAGISLILDSFHLLLYGILRGHHQLSIESLGMFTGQLLTAITGAIVLWLSPSLTHLFLALLTGSVLNVILSTSVLIKKFSLRLFLPIFDASVIKQLLKKAFPFALAAIFVKVYSSVDTLFISKFLDNSSMGFYGLAYKFTYAFQFLPLAFTAALYPSFSSAIEHDPSGLALLFRRSMWYLMMLSIPIVFGIWLIAKPLVLLAGPAYEPASFILSILIFVLIPIFLDFPIGSLLNAANRQGTKTAIMGVTMCLNVILNAWLVPWMGMRGAAYASLVSFVMMFFCGLFFVPKIIPNVSLTAILKDFLSVFVSGVAMSSVGLFVMGRIGWVATIPVCILVYLLGLLFTRVLTIKDLKLFGRLLSYERSSTSSHYS